MMDFHKTKACQNCTISVPLEKVHLYPLTLNGGQISNLILCEKCYLEKKSIQQQSKIQDEKPKKTKPIYMHYFCEQCKYRFRIDENKLGVSKSLSCPYCGKGDKLSCAK